MQFFFSILRTWCSWRSRASEANEPLVREIVRRFDCMSLAIDLTAARVRMPQCKLARDLAGASSCCGESAATRRPGKRPCVARPTGPGSSREVGNRRAEGMALANLGLLHRKYRRPVEALACYEQALAIHREVGNRQSEAVVLGNLGSIFHDEGDFPTAEQHLEQAIEIGDKVRYPIAGACRGTLALLRAEAAHFTQVGELLEMADSQLRDVQPGELAKLLSKRARVEHLAGDPGAASAAFAEAEAIAEELEAAPSSDLGLVLATAREALAGPSGSS